jgi:hypothetical protein
MSYTNGLDKPTDYFNTKIFTGNNSANNSITGIGFKPDWIWFKNRNSANDHALVDSVRGRKALSSNNTSAELTLNADKDFQSFDSDGFTVDVVEQLNSFNKSGDSIVTWNWLAGGSASSNTDGSITTSVSANTTAGFSIVSYTSNGSASQTVGHGLGIPPNVIISKNRTDGGTTYGNWVVYHSSLATANDKKTLLNSNSASSTTNEWGDTDPTSSVYSVHTSGDGATNHSTDNIIAYCFAEKKGYSKFGSYTGNGTNNNGTFFYCGFSASVVIIKASSSSRNWVILDNKRLGYNDKNYRLFPNLTNAEDTTSGIIDFTANGFKLMSNNNTVNESGVTYIVMAFAESPFVNSNGVPTNAR